MQYILKVSLNNSIKARKPMKPVPFKSHITGTAISLGAECMRFIKLSFIVGSETAFFSAAHCVRPLTGLYSGVRMSAGILLLRSFLSIFYLHMVPALALVYHIPTFFASLYWSVIPQKPAHFSRFLMALFPIACFMSFVLHPVGSQAVSYACFWIIPLCSIVIAHNNVFIHALASTFMAHAAGSVIWLYTIGPVSSVMWKALIPVVLVERLLFASGMTFCILAISVLKVINWRRALQSLWSLGRKKALSI